MANVLKNKTIVLGVCGGIAAYKSAELLRLLTKARAHVRVLMTRNAHEFIGPLTFEALCGLPVSSDLFERGEEVGTQHIDWAQGCNAVVIAPATANFIGKLANGIADDALTTFMTAVTCPVMICPSMNTNMWYHKPVQRNIERLTTDGYRVLSPDAGELACGTTGPGRLPEPGVIFDRLIKLLSPQDLSGQTILVTAGPTREPIDPVRFISNPSSGKMGYALARAAEHRGARVCLISGPTHLTDPLNVTVIQVETAAEMAAAVFDHMAAADVVIKTAAVSDFKPTEMANHKIKKDTQGDMPVVHLCRTTDILKVLGEQKEKQLLVGFAAETGDMDRYARQKLTSKNLDLIVANLIGAPQSGFASDTNAVSLFYRNGNTESLPVMPKAELAHMLLDRILAMGSLPAGMVEA